MSLGNIVRKAGLYLTLTGATIATLFTLGTRMVSADPPRAKKSKPETKELVVAPKPIAQETKETILPEVTEYVVPDNIFPNPDVPYQIPKNVAQVELEGYLFEVLEKNEYGDLAKQLRNLPGFEKEAFKERLEALDDIVAVAVDATSPEIRELFNLMLDEGIKKGSKVNGNIKALLVLAYENDFKKNDLLALSIAKNHGFYLSIGDKKVEQLVRQDMNALLSYFREINHWHKTIGWVPLEARPLLDLIALTWRGNSTTTKGAYALIGPETKHSYRRGFKKKNYLWTTVSIEGLREAKRIAEEKNWVSDTINETVWQIKMDTYSGKTLEIPKAKRIRVHGELVRPRNMNNADYEIECYRKSGKIIGNCADEMVFVDAVLKSLGVPTLACGYYWSKENKRMGHTHILYSDDHSLWKGDPTQLEIGSKFTKDKIDVYIFSPTYLLKYGLECEKPRDGSIFKKVYRVGAINQTWVGMLATTFPKKVALFTRGVSSEIMKEFILYHKPIDLN